MWKVRNAYHWNFFVAWSFPKSHSWMSSWFLLKQDWSIFAATLTPGLHSRIRSLAVLPSCFSFSLSVYLPLGCLIPDLLLYGRLSQEAVVYSTTLPCSTDLSPTMDLFRAASSISYKKRILPSFSFFFLPSLLFTPSFKVTNEIPV